MTQHQLKAFLFSGSGTHHRTTDRLRHAKAGEGEAITATGHHPLGLDKLSRRFNGFMQRARLEPQLHPRQFGCTSACGVWVAQLQSQPPIPTHNATDAVGIALTPQAPGLGGIDHLTVSVCSSPLR